MPSKTRHELPATAKSGQLHATRNDLSEATRAKVIELTQPRLADAIDLMLQCKQAHWNVKGPSFIALHELFDKLADIVEEFVDELAERIVSLGGTADGTLQGVGKRSSLPAYPANISDGRDHVEALAASLAAFGKEARQTIDAVTALQDSVSADVFTGIAKEIDKQLWFLEAHLQGR